MTPIGTVIQPGQPIPDDVTGILGAAGSPWRLTAKGHWHLSTAQVTCLHDGCGTDGYGLMRAGDRALTVTAVREQPAEPERSIGPCPVCGSVAPHGAHEQSAEPDDVPAESEPQQVASPLLAALVPQQPVQARGPNGWPWWIHSCGRALGSIEAPRDDDPRCGCNRPGPWQPLYIVAAPDGDRAPKASPFGVQGWVHVDGTPCPEYLAPSHYKTLWCTTHGMNVSLPEPVPTDAELDFQIGEVTRERDEALAALERMTGENGDLRGEIKRLTAVAAAELRDARSEVERLKRDYVTGKTWREQREAHLAEQRAAQPDPLVLRLSNEPEAAVALIGVKSGRRYEPSRTGSGAWRDMTTEQTMPYIRVMEREREVRVELAPAPREQRTWPKLDDEPDALPQVVDVAGNGRWRLMNGRIYRQGTLADNTIRDATLAELRQLGDVTEVLDRKPPP